jgi:type I restriction enzyme S subunit
MEAVGELGNLDLSRSKPLGKIASGYTFFRDGDVVVAKITPCFENRKGARAIGLTGGIAFGTTELCVLRPRDSTHGQFLFYLTLSDAFRRRGEAEMYGAGGQKRVPDAFISNLKSPLPPRSEQSAIATFLDREAAKIDALVAKKERLIELLREKRNALITRAVTKGLDPEVPLRDSEVEWVGQIPAHWDLRQLRRAIRKFVDYRGATPKKAPAGIRLVTATNIKLGRIDYLLGEEFIREEDYADWMAKGSPRREMS